jgi:putative spermidine/putrescine transport system substrate-binding protein
MKRRMKKLCVCAVLCFLMLSPFTLFAGGQGEGSAAGSGGGKPKVTLWATGSDNVRMLFEKLIDEYNAKPDSSSVVELQFVMSGSGGQTLSDRIAAAKLAGKTDTDFDLLAENGSALASYVDKAGGDLFVPLDFSKIPNYANVKMKSGFFTDCVVPYRGTTVVMAYDSIRLPNPPKTWEELDAWITSHPGRFAYNPPGSGGSGAGFVNLALYKDLPPEAKVSTDEKWVEQWGPGWDWLESIHPYLYKSGGKIVYPNKNQGTLDLLINKEVDLIPAWADQVLTNISRGILPESTKIYQLTPALNGTDVVLAVPNIGGGAEKTYDFINFMISPEAQKICLETIFAVPVIDSSLIDSTYKTMVKDLDISGFSVISNGKLGDVRNQYWDKNIARLP